MQTDITEPPYAEITSAKTSNYFTKEHFQEQLQRIKDASDVAQKKIDYATAHNDEILYAIEIVEQFLRKSGRICYGGQAINAHLPNSHKIYDPTYSIPDYDFFSPSPDQDLTKITNALQRAGFTEISIREGMHEGTTKVYVNFIPVADCTELHSKIYDTLYKRSAVFDGIHYMDASSLRMLMYLELSRPRGEVSRWGKVFERLMIFNEFLPAKHCNIYHKNPVVTETHINIMVSYCVDHTRIFAGADLIEFYEHAIQKGIELRISTNKPVLFYSPHSRKDAMNLVSLFRSYDHKKYTVKTITIHKSDVVPYFTMIMHGKHIMACIIEYSACHSYIRVPFKNHATKKKDHIHIASLDTIITLYFSLGLLDKRLFNIGSMECMANKLVEISLKTRVRHGSTTLPFISIECQGYQKTLPSLIREKVERITRKRNAEKRNADKRKTVRNLKKRLL